MPGDPAPLFRAPSNINRDFDFSSAAGRYIVLSFLGAAQDAGGRFQPFLSVAPLFANPDRYFFGVVLGTAEKGDPTLLQQRSGMDTFWDEGMVSRLYGALPEG